ncbi:MAG: type II toxin-antitoxin system VapC family toxin [Candidatus Dadabacteria bacterium]|nr:MAG: type II toxin-antitoxin system VapC family toxin [Candidatus Dadabacteria bacterium]
MTDRYLLDTHIWLWWLADAPKLSATAREIIADGANTILLSAVSTWECVIKSALGKLQLPSDVSELVEFSEYEDGFDLLSVRHEHAARLAELPLIHRDPFDRMLVAQALHEHATIITADATLAAYPPEILKV